MYDKNLFGLTHCLSVLPGDYYRVVGTHKPLTHKGMFTYKIFFKEPLAVWGQGCVLVQEASEDAARLFFNREFPGYLVDRITLTLHLPI